MVPESDIVDARRAASREPLKRMVGLRNVAVHEYRKLDLELVAALARGDLPAFAAHAVRTAS